MKFIFKNDFSNHFRNTNRSGLIHILLQSLYVFLHRNLVPKQELMLNFVLYWNLEPMVVPLKSHTILAIGLSLSTPSPKIQEEDGILFLYVMLQCANSECLWNTRWKRDEKLTNHHGEYVGLYLFLGLQPVFALPVFPTIYEIGWPENSNWTNIILWAL